MSEITIAVGKIGAGKSLWGTSVVCQELKRTERMIVTNLPVWPGMGDSVPAGKITLAQWCQEFCSRPVKTWERVRVLDRTECLDFYCHYPGFDIELEPMQFKLGVDHKGARRVESNFEMVPNLAARASMQAQGLVPFGTLFIIDEAHTFFSARHWADVSRGCEMYMSQCRKLNDDVICITQDPGKLDKNFRRNATRWLYLENMSKKRLFMGVTFNNQFRYYEYDSEPQKNDQPVRKGKFTLQDGRYSECYDTSAGVGLAGTLLPEEATKKGGHWWRWVALVFVMAILGVIAPRVAMLVIGKSVHGALKGFGETAVGHIVGAGVVSGAPVTNGHVEPSTGVSSNVFVPLLRVAPSSFFSSNVFWCGTVIESNTIQKVILTDGSVYTLPELQLVARDWVKIDGVMYKRLKSALSPSLGTRILGNGKEQNNER